MAAQRDYQRDHICGQIRVSMAYGIPRVSALVNCLLSLQ